MRVTVKFWSYYRDLTGCGETTAEMPAGATLGDLFAAMLQRFPRLAGAQKCTLKAVGLDYQADDYRLQPDDDVSFFPPVQGG